MTKLTYILYDGTMTTSYATALATGRPYTRRYEPVKKQRTEEEKALADRRFSAITGKNKGV